MNILVTGGCKNGKSSLAEQITAGLSDEGHRYYVATMIPGDAEDEARIEKHRKSRAGKHFKTLEWPFSASFSEEDTDPEGTFLVDSVTAILGNEMFRPPAWECDSAAGERVKAALVQFAGKVRNAVFVTDAIGHDAEDYGETTEIYRASLADCGRALAETCDTVIWVSAGVPRFIKKNGFSRVFGGAPHCEADEILISKVGHTLNPDGNEMPVSSWFAYGGGSDADAEYTASSAIVSGESSGEMRGGIDELLSLPHGSGMKQSGEKRNIAELVIGGAYQGKGDYVRRKYNFPEAAILDCGSAADAGKAFRVTDFHCVLHLERYILECVKQDAQPVDPFLFVPGTVLVCDDIFCGVVPMDPVLRRWREECGRYLMRTASLAASVTRVTCGLPERLK